jgi:hypothetical protein
LEVGLTTPSRKYILLRNHGVGEEPHGVVEPVEEEEEEEEKRKKKKKKKKEKKNLPIQYLIIIFQSYSTIQVLFICNLIDL